ncbi:MAG: hypothetical protein ACOVOV_16415 [Dolichospermum sp.]|jgi:hypothetical protein
MKVKVIVLFAISILSFAFLIISKKLGLSWVEILGIFVGVLSLVVAVWVGFKSVNDAEQTSISDVKKDLIFLIENIKRDKEETDKSQNKDLELIKQQTALLSNLIQEQNRINAEISSMARDFEQLSAALAQNSKYTEVLKRQSNIERRVEKLENEVY